MPLRALQVLKFFFILTVADISCFARQFCFMIRSRKERHFVHHAMVQTLFILFINVSFFIFSLSLSLSTLLSVLNQSCPLLCFYATFHFAVFFFRRLWSFYTSNHATYITHAVCKKLKFKRVLTLSLRMTGIWHVLISMYTRTMQEDVPFLLHVLWNTIHRKERWLMPYIDFSFRNIDNKLHAMIKKWTFRNIGKTFLF